MGDSHTADKVTFLAEKAINHRLADPALWPPKVTGGFMVNLYKYCASGIREAACETYDYADAAAAIDRVAQPMRQMFNDEQMAAARELLANAFIQDTCRRDAVKQELKEQFGPST